MQPHRSGESAYRQPSPGQAAFTAQPSAAGSERPGRALPHGTPWPRAAGGGGGRRSQGWGRGFHTRTRQFLVFPAPALRAPAATRGLFVYKRITSAPPSLPGLWARPLALFPPPPAPNLLASQWCDLGIGRSQPSRSSYALPLRGAIKSAARSQHLFAPQSWKCKC